MHRAAGEVAAHDLVLGAKMQVGGCGWVWGPPSQHLVASSPSPLPPRQQDKEYIGSRVARLQKHAQKVAAELRARAAEVRVRKGHLG